MGRTLMPMGSPCALIVKNPASPFPPGRLHLLPIACPGTAKSEALPPRIVCRPEMLRVIPEGGLG